MWQACKYVDPHGAKVNEGWKALPYNSTILRTFGIGSAYDPYKTKIMYRTLLIILALAYGLNMSAQKGVYEDLLVLFVDEKYENVL